MYLVYLALLVLHGSVVYADDISYAGGKNSATQYIETKQTGTEQGEARWDEARWNESRRDKIKQAEIQSIEKKDNASAATTGTSAATSNVQWVLGVGLGVLDYHLYPGAAESNRLILPLPYFTFRSASFEIDRGIKSFLYHSEKIVLDISADFGLPVDSDESQARQGMSDLDLVLQIGPSLEILLNDERESYFDMRFELPLRAAFATDFHGIDNIGCLLEPRFSFNHPRRGQTGLAQKATVGLTFATQAFHAYYYDVADEFTTVVRQGFSSSEGFGGSFVKYKISFKTRDFIYWTFVRYQSLRGAAFEDSPLVVQKDYYFLGFGFAWLFAGS